EARHDQITSVDDERRAFADARLDVVEHAAAVRVRAERSHVDGRRRGAVADSQPADPLPELVDERVADLADGDRDGDSHAALAGRAEARADQRVRGLVEVRVGHYGEMVLRAAERLDAFAV